MISYVIEGGQKLEGICKISGSKNASLPIIAACILNKGITKLYNVPNIHDTKMMLEILKNLGCKIKSNGTKITIDAKNIIVHGIPENLMRQMRSSVIIAGAIIGRFNKATFSYPGGCEIGARPIDLHLSAFKKLNVDIEEENGFIKCKTDKIVGSNIHLDFPSVGATENAMLAAVLADGNTIIENAAMEPEIVDLQKFLVKMGAKVKGAGTNVIRIEGVKTLNKNISYNIMPDRIEAGTILCMVATTGGNARIENMIPDHIGPLVYKLQETGCNLTIEKNSILIKAPKRLKAVDIKTMPYPGFPTDMQSVFSSMLVTAKGTSVITENIFENRYKYINELIRMGAKITVEGRTAVITGVKKLSNANVNCTDLRGGAALTNAALVTKGITQVNNIEYILRGYENLDRKLRELGANIKIKRMEV